MVFPCEIGQEFRQRLVKAFASVFLGEKGKEEEEGIGFHFKCSAHFAQIFYLIPWMPAH